MAKKNIKIIWLGLSILLGSLFFSGASFALALDLPLPANQAFVLSTAKDATHPLFVEWRIAPGYYLYRQRIHINATPAILTNVQFPQGDLKYDPDRGRYEAYSGDIIVPLTLQKTAAQNINLSIDYQGCSQDGFCYPPMHQDIVVNLATGTMRADNSTLGAPPAATSSSLSTLLTHQQGVISLLQSQSFGTLLLIFAALGVLLTFTPCVLPMIPILTSIIVGQKQPVTTRKAFFLSATYVLGSAITYALAGVLAAALGSTLQVWLQTSWAIVIVSALFVLLAFSLFGFYDLQLPRTWQNRLNGLSNQYQGGRYVSVFIMGMISTLIVSPCVTAPLVGVLAYIAQTGNLALGASALFMMGTGMGIPLLLIGTSAGKWLPKAGLWMEVVKKIFGVLMLGMAIWLLTRATSTTVAVMLWGGLLIGIAVFLGLYLPKMLTSKTWARSIALILGLSGIVVMVGGANFSRTQGWMHNSPTAPPLFTTVHDVSAFDKQLALAKANHQPIMLDFYADWCESCVVMDRNVFNLPTVRKELVNNKLLLRADLSANNSLDEAMMKRFNVIAPPTILFFDADGQEINSKRIVGEVNAKEFLARLPK